MFFQKDENGEVKIPQGFISGDGIVTRDCLRITIEEVQIVTKPEVEYRWFDKETGKVYQYYSVPDDRKELCIKIKYATGLLETKEYTKKIFEQTKNSLDIADIALYINRVR